MKQIIAKKDFVYKGKTYFSGEELDINELKDIVTLNEKGFIEPLSFKDLTLLKRELENKKDNKKGGIINATIVS